MTKTIARPGIKLPPQIVDDLTRKEFLIGAGLIALAPACGSDEQGGSDASGETRTVEHALGTTEVPVSPERVVTLFGPTLAALSAVGVGLAGSTGYEPSGDHGLNYYAPEGELDELEFVGIQGQPNIERIAVVNPDLIMGVSVYEEQNYERLSEIAPTVLFDWKGTTSWKEHFDEVVAAVGEEEEGRRVVEDYESRAEGIGRRLGNPGEIEVSYLEWNTEGFRIYLDNSFAGSILKDVGLSRPESQVATGDEEFSDFVEYSFEKISVADADVIFVATRDEDERTSFADFQSNPLWEKLDAVENGEVYEVVGFAWGGSNYFAANLVLDDIEKHLLDG